VPGASPKALAVSLGPLPVSTIEAKIAFQSIVLRFAMGGW